MADRVMSGKGDASASQAISCHDAKSNAIQSKNSDEHVKHYWACDCARDRQGYWECSVDATVEKDKKGARAERELPGKGDQSASRITSCEDAKSDAIQFKYPDEHVEHYSACDCAQNQQGYWECTVNATVEKDKK